MKKALQFLRKNSEILFFIFAFIVWTAFMCYENAKEGGDFSWHDLKVEANGMIFDLFVFGILVTTYNAIRARKEKIERLKEEIDDYRGWNGKEAMYRILGAIKRLERVGVHYTDLHGCFLAKSNFFKANLKGANLANANFRQADLVGANLEDANLKGANLNKAMLLEANLAGATLTGANLIGAYLVRVNFAGADFSEYCFPTGGKYLGAYLGEANLTEANLTGTNLTGVNVGVNWFEKIEKWEVLGREEIKQKYIIDEEGVLRLK